MTMHFRLSSSRCLPVLLCCLPTPIDEQASLHEDGKQPELDRPSCIMGIARLFKRTPNHIKLVRDCYPHTKTAVEPESNALGKLTFYTRRRPIKLSKVGKALLRRTQKSSETIEHLCITLSILKKLLDECRNDVNVFSSEAMAIIDIAFKRAQAASKLSTTNPHTLVELYEKTAGAVSHTFPRLFSTSCSQEA